ncbi:MAG TPA: DegQ family serine endoprotease [Rhizomicrobium sp.]|jgi:serine protease Do|nr:DegQ family serine endoprotease [Rhizomicrobium sp.]
MPNEHRSLFSRLPKPSLRQRRLFALSSAATILVVGLGAFALLPQVRPTRVADHAPPLQLAANETGHPTPRMLDNGTPFSFADLVERVSPAVVSIRSETVSTQSDSDGDNLPAPFRDFFNQFGQGQHIQPHKAISAGSGFIIDKTGYIVTNNHVIDASKKITVTLPDKREFTAKLVGTDPSTDIALLKIKSDKPLPTVEFGDDKRLRVGDWVIAVGNPFGLSNTVTAGIVSSIGRDIGESSQQYTNFIQIDAPINRGNSGGPTFDLRGQVIGMNSMIFSPSGGSVGIGFAIPASLIHDVVAQLKEHGHVNRGWLGVEIQPVTPEIASAMGLKDNKGALVAGVVPNGPAAKAGFQQGDVVTAIDGQVVSDSREVVRRVAALPAGRSSTFTITRQGKPSEIKVTIGEKPDDKVAANMMNGGAGTGQASANAMGLGLSSLTPEARHAYNLGDDVSGVVITKVDPDSDAADKGLQPGDVVVKIGSHQVHTPADVQSGVAEAQKGGRKSVLMLVARQAGGTVFVALDIGQT